MSKVDISPEIRFYEFNENLEVKKLCEVSTYSNGGSYENDVQNKGKYELITLKSINMSGNLVCSGKYINIKAPTLSKDTLVMILSEQSPGLLGMTALIPSAKKYVLNQRVAEIKPFQNVDSYFLSMAINKNQVYFSKRGAGTKVQNISKGNVENYEFYSPSLPEQQKIGTYFKQIDQLITLKQKKHTKLLNLKKAMLNKMFPQNGATTPEIRFKGFEGEWEEKSLGEIAKITTGSSNREDSGLTGKYTFFDRSDDIRTSDIYLFDCEAVIVAGEGSDFIPKYFIGKFDLHQRTYAIINKPHYDGRFLFYFIHLFRAWFFNQAVGSTVKSLRLPMFQEMPITLPAIIEQQKIGNYFKKLDQLISLQEKEITKLQHIKKALLEKMFV
ncbi:MAG: restriction endonuclease subunit S [Labilibaculum sp.]|nr:restriction endonuclease subunit S [Labilibaculum sp.]MBI9056976.1 restriction endonuclease subunit S [Labilibaculum sp.]